MENPILTLSAVLLLGALLRICQSSSEALSKACLLDGDAMEEDPTSEGDLVDVDAVVE